MDFVFFTDDTEDAMRLLASNDLCSVLWELDTWLRNEIKYNDRNDLQEIRDKLTQLMKDHGVDLERIYS